MGAAWEWRGFRAITIEPDLVEMAAMAARSLGMSVSEQVMLEHDSYLVLPNVRHNLKIRKSTLEIKLQIERRTGGFSLWEDKEVHPFPLRPEQVERILGWAKGRQEKQIRPIGSPSALVETLRQNASFWGVVSVRKRRIRITDGPTRLEIADLQMSENLRFLSYCVDGYKLDDVKNAVRRSDLRTTVRVLSYVDLIREAIWWYPGLGENGAVG